MLNLPNGNGKITPAQILMPVGLVAFVMFLMLAYQFTQVISDRQMLRQAVTQQQVTFDEATKLQAQVNALAIGTQKLADKGNKGAKGIIERMNKLGIAVNMPGAQPAQAAASPMQQGMPNGAMQPASGQPMPAPHKAPPTPSR